jgi:phosphoribosyl 1,2-cyclic phosphodiesterase
MRFASLGSGSKGNATIIDSGGTAILVDCGFSVKTLVSRLDALSMTPSTIAAIVVTHEHSDHWKGVNGFSERYGTPVYLSAGCSRARGILKDTHRFTIIDCHKPFMVGDLHLLPVPVPHDANEPIQYVVSNGECKLGILTDLGHYTPHVISTYSGCDGLILECNYDEQMLHSGPYPKFLKQRVSGKFGHLSNRQAGQLLSKIDLSRLKTLVLAHISESNNHGDIVIQEINQLLPEGLTLVLANQNRVSGWFELV